MAESKERRKTPRRATNGRATNSNSTPKPDNKAGAPRRPTSEQRAAPMAGNLRPEVSPEEAKRLIAEAAYYRAKQRGFEPGHELEDWVEAESEVMGRLHSQAH